MVFNIFRVFFIYFYNSCCLPKPKNGISLCWSKVLSSLVKYCNIIN